MTRSYTSRDEFTFFFPSMDQPRKRTRKPVTPSVSVQIEAPEGRTVDSVREGDCTIRAIAKFMDFPYAEVKDLMKRDYGYRPRGGVSLYNFNRFAKDFGLKYVEARIRLNSKTAKDKLPKKAILLFKRHVAAYEDGTIFDTYATTNVAGCKQTHGYYVKA